jgi:hypothetical protein
VRARARERQRDRETTKGRRERERDDQEQEEGRGARVKRKLDSIKSARSTQERRAGGRDVGRRGERRGARGGQGRVVNAPVLRKTGKSIGAACNMGREWMDNIWTARERRKQTHECLPPCRRHCSMYTYTPEKTHVHVNGSVDELGSEEQMLSLVRTAPPKAEFGIAALYSGDLLNCQHVLELADLVNGGKGHLGRAEVCTSVKKTKIILNYSELRSKRD